MLTLNRLTVRVSLTLFLAASLFAISGCTTNAVTGKRQLVEPVSQQIEQGTQYYGPSQQQQGGRYVVDPDLSVYVNQVGQNVAAFSPLKLPYEFVVLNNDVPNAWALPGGKIAVNRGLLTILDDEAQLAAVLGHEVIHAAAEHSANQMAKAKLVSAAGAVVAAGAVASKNENALLIGAGVAIGGKVYQAHYGRSQELEADLYGIDLMVAAGYEPQASVEIQQKFVELSKGAKADFFSQLFASHPPSQERVEKNKKKTAGLAPGKRKKKAFQNAMAQLKKDQPAYDSHAKALKAAKEGDTDKALSLVNESIKKQPEEALFYITKGQILMEKKDTKAANQAFATAARKNPDYYMGHLGKGMTDMENNNPAAAKKSFSRSMELLPTHVGAYYLGEISLKEGNKNSAIDYFKFASESPDEIGKAAQSQLVKLQTNTQ